jgi:hypothetical protein
LQFSGFASLNKQVFQGVQISLISDIDLISAMTGMQRELSLFNSVVPFLSLGHHYGTHIAAR